MKKRYRIALVVLGCLIVLVGLSYAYFLATSNTEGEGGSTTVNTVILEEVGFNIEGVLEFNDLDIYPGHKNISKIKVSALGNNDTINYKLVWEGINTLNTPLKYYVYKTTTDEIASITCKKEIEQIGSSKHYYETCTNNNFENLGSIISSGEITKAENKEEFTLKNEEVIKGTKEGSIVYYYVVLEYPNLEESQNIDMGGKFEGKVTVKKEEDLLADITIKKMYKAIENGYEEITSMPSEGYQINTEKSTCTNNATPTLKDNKILVTNLTNSGTECNIYFDKLPTSEDTIKKLNINPSYIKEGNPDFTKIATGAETVADNGIYKTSDPMYGENAVTYYWRGAATTNYLKFAGFCWRIIRINGDGSIRLIYDGTTCHANGANTTENIAVSNQAYNFNYNHSEYVGYTYVEEKQRPENNATGTASNLKIKTEDWFDKNITGENLKKVDLQGKYCNDRNIASGYVWAISPTKTFYYAAYERLYTNKTPTLACDSKDVYTLKVGAITADEVAYAGGKWLANNREYYLYNGKYYLTMSPCHWYYESTSTYRAQMFSVNSDGYLIWTYVSNSHGIRPVINLRSDVTFNAGSDGTQNNPYVVKGAE